MIGSDAGLEARVPLRLESNRLVLREISDSDSARLVELFAEPVAQQFILNSQKDPASIRAYAARAAKFAGRTDRTSFHFIVELKGTGIVIGTIGVSNVWPSSSIAALGWHFGHAYSGRGYATEAGKTLLRFTFADRKVARVTADCLASNAACIRVIQKLGMRRRFFWWLLDMFLPKAYGESNRIVRHATTRIHA